jgi:hypothetical protein
LIETICAGLPTADFRGGADVVIAHAAFITARRLHYFREVLAVYRVHGDNNVGALEGGRLVPKYSVAPLWPKRICYFEKLVDSLAGDERARQERLAYLKRLERDVRSTSSSLPVSAAGLSFVVLADRCDDAAARTLDSISAQTRASVHTVIVTPPANGPDWRQAAGAANVVRIAEDAGLLERMAAGYFASKTAFVCFAQAGDRFDPTYAERQMYMLQYSAPAMLSACDLRLTDEAGVLLHSMPFYTSGAWRLHGEFVAPLSAWMQETRWPPIGSTVFRRSRYLDRLFGLAGTPDGRDVGAQAPWLLQQYATALGGGLRLGECLFSHPVGDASAAGAVRALTEPGGDAASEPDLAAAAALLLATFCGARPAFDERYPETWRANLVAWLAHRQAPAGMERLRAVARDHGDEEIMDLIEAVAALAS